MLEGVQHQRSLASGPPSSYESTPAIVISFHKRTICRSFFLSICLPSQASLGRTYGLLTGLLDDLGQPFLEAIAEREARADRIEATTLKVFRSLLTPGTRKQIPEWLKDPHIKLNDLHKHVEEATHKMWVEFHWSCTDPGAEVHPAVRMSPHPSPILSVLYPPVCVSPCRAALATLEPL